MLKRKHSDRPKALRASGRQQLHLEIRPEIETEPRKSEPLTDKEPLCDFYVHFRV